jgi:hypothetical protein
MLTSPVTVVVPFTVCLVVKRRPLIWQTSVRDPAIGEPPLSAHQEGNGMTASVLGADCLCGLIGVMHADVVAEVSTHVAARTPDLVVNGSGCREIGMYIGFSMVFGVVVVGVTAAFPFPAADAGDGPTTAMAEIQAAIATSPRMVLAGILVPSVMASASAPGRHETITPARD